MIRIITLIFSSLLIFITSVIDIVFTQKIFIIGSILLVIFLLLMDKRKIVALLLVFWIIIGGVFYFLGPIICSFPITAEEMKLTHIFYVINQAERKYFNGNKRYGVLQELEKECISPDIMQDIRKMRFFMITIWADTKSFQCIASTNVKGLDSVYKLDETGILKEYRMGKTYYILPNDDLKFFDFDNSINEEEYKKLK